MNNKTNITNNDIKEKANIQNNSKSYKNKWIMLGVLVTQPFMACIDGSIINVALPTIRENLGITMSSAEWIVSSYLIVISAAILIFGRLGDLKSKSKVFLKGILVFVLGSLFCSLSPNIELLVISRIIQAIGAAMIMATNQGLIADIFPLNERGKALGISGSFVALGSILGPALGGAIISYLSWHFIFLINIPIGLIAYFIGMKTLPVKESNSDETMDKIGATVFVLSILFLFTSILLSQNLGFKNIFIISGLVMGIIFLIIFLIIESKVDKPMLDLSLFKVSSFSINLVCAFISFATINAINIILPFYFTDILKYTPAGISVLMLFNPIVLLFVAPLSGALSDKIGSKKLTLLGLFGTTSIIFGMSFLNEYSTKLHIILLLSLLGLSSGIFNSPNTNIVMSSVPKDKLGIAGSTNALIRNLGLAFGVSLSTSILYSRMSRLAGYRVLEAIPGKDYIFVYGMKGVYITLSIVCLCAFLLSLIDKLKTSKNNKSV
ncbi:MFS transporter [Clostridium uliginosum]|uniref:Drug resistance transporter, EmrB/QacA subfamily n=1 Tax=Clostridium uliginosum TaxID=119641 RepID=A0A1I1S3B1_9CLOT|nr:drug resistance transporter, EmrB/QacA subfamily [Clostridium uliginosum]